MRAERRKKIYLPACYSHKRLPIGEFFVSWTLGFWCIILIMAIPRHNEIYREILELIQDERECNYKELEERLSQKLKISPEERAILLESGVRTIFMDRIGWSIVYMKKAGLIERPRRGYFQITSEGKKVLERDEEIDDKVLMRYPSYVEFRTIKKHEHPEEDNGAVNDSLTPNEILERGYKSISRNLQIDLLEQIKLCSPSFFESLVIDLLTTMGYGGSRKDAGEAIGRSGDEGIDGVIKEDKLGLDVIYIQAKRWQGTVGRPEIQKFVGALHGKHARKGIFITTSNYSPDAISYASSVESKVILIDGELISKLMIENNVGVSIESTYQIKRVDTDYFIEN